MAEHDEVKAGEASSAEGKKPLRRSRGAPVGRPGPRLNIPARDAADEAADHAALEELEAATPAGAHQSVLPPYETIALMLQGGGALGAYQAGVYQGLNEAGIHPNWIAGISIGALNTAIIAGNAPENRVPRLLEFWETICQPAFMPPLPAFLEHAFFNSTDEIRKAFTAMQAASALVEGQK